MSLVGAAGLEPATGRFEGGDSIQLSYAPNSDFLFVFGFVSLGPPSFGSMNSTPAASNEKLWRPDRQEENRVIFSTY